MTGDGPRTYTYDVENRLVASSSGAALSYDPLGRLQSITDGTAPKTRFVYDGDQLTEEVMSGAIARRYVHGAGADDPLVWYQGADLTDGRALFADQQGSITAVASLGGGAASLDSYDEYGIPAAGNIGRFAYTGQAWLPELGMYYYKARVYSPTLGRFPQTDPVGYEDQVNLYAYVGNDPVNGRDPKGLERCEGASDDCQKVAAGAQMTRDMANKTPEDSELRKTALMIGPPGEGSLVIADPTLNIEAHFDKKEGSDGAIVIGDRMLRAGPAAIGGAIAHEGTHERDYRKDHDYLKTGERRMEVEKHAYTVENEYRSAKGWAKRDVDTDARKSFEAACKDSRSGSCR